MFAARCPRLPGSQRLQRRLRQRHGRPRQWGDDDDGEIHEAGADFRRGGGQLYEYTRTFRLHA